MVFKCEICKVLFTNNYLLSKHKNRKIPCNIVFECIKCKKKLVNQYSLEKHYNKKNPCTKISNNKKPNNIKNNIIILEKMKEIELEIQKEKSKQKEIDQKFKLELNKQKEEEQKNKKKEKQRIEEEKRDILELEIQREIMLEFEREQLKIQLTMEKTKQMELKVQMQREKAQLLKDRKELEYARAFQKTQNHMASIKLYAENNKQKKEDKIEILKIKAKLAKDIEVMKNDRKEQTPQIINNNITINNINICINHIKEHHMDKLDINFKDMQKSAMEYFKQNTIDCSENKSVKFLLDIFNSNETCNGIMDHILRIAYNNIERDDKRCVWYMKDPQYYFTGSIENNEKIVKIIDFDKVLFPLFKHMLSTILIKITNVAKKYVKMTFDNENKKNQDNFIKHNNLLYYQRNVLPFTESLSDIKKLSNIIFEIESPSKLPIIV